VIQSVLISLLSLRGHLAPYPQERWRSGWRTRKLNSEMRTLWITALVATRLASAQSHVQVIQAVDQVRQISGNTIPKILDLLPQLTLGPLRDNAATALLAKSSSGSERFFQWHLGEPTGTETLIDSDLDILVAHWDKTGNKDLPAEVWMWDDPIGTTFLIPLPLEAVRDRTQLEKFFGSLWVWWEPDPPPDPPQDPLSPVRLPRRTAPLRVTDSRTKEFQLELAPIPAEGLFGSGRSQGDGFGTARLGRYRPLVALYRRGDRVWISIEVGKEWLGYPSGMYEVAERFPPLEERVADWSLNRLLLEYGRPLVNDIMIGTLERDGILVRELIRRDVDPAVLQKLLDRQPLNVPNAVAQLQELATVTSVLVNQGKSKPYEPVLREAITRATRSPNEILANMLARLQTARDVDVSDLALECVGKFRYGSDGGLSYLEVRGHTVEIYLALQAKVVPQPYEADKARALAAIQKRLP
jgi:hypothetical protein